MKENMKRFTWGLLAIAVIIMMFPAGKVSAAAHLKQKDFVFKVDGKKYDFINKVSAKDETYYWVQQSVTDKSGYVKGENSSFMTNRKIKFYSKASTVIKKYGKVKKKKVTSKETFQKFMKYNGFTVDTSQWKKYLEYSYKKGKNQYKLRFYLNKKDKVVAVVYLKNLNGFEKYPDKEMETGLKFTAPKGKKVTTKKICGKKVYFLPKGTKISFDQSKINFDLGGQDYWFYQYDKYGKRKADAGGLAPFFFDEEYVIDDLISDCYKWNAKKQKYTNQKLNINKLGSYRYFVIRFWNDGCEHLAPQVYYIRIK